jgi:hypothetical protein
MDLHVADHLRSTPPTMSITLTVRPLTKDYLQQNLRVVKLCWAGYIARGSFRPAVPQTARTKSALIYPNVALAGNCAGRLYGPRGTLARVLNLDEEGGAYAYSA